MRSTRRRRVGHASGAVRSVSGRRCHAPQHATVGRPLVDRARRPRAPQRPVPPVTRGRQPRMIRSGAREAVTPRRLPAWPGTELGARVVTARHVAGGTESSCCSGCPPPASAAGQVACAGEGRPTQRAAAHPGRVEGGRWTCGRFRRKRPPAPARAPERQRARSVGGCRGRGRRPRLRPTGRRCPRRGR